MIWDVQKNYTDTVKLKEHTDLRIEYGRMVKKAGRLGV